MLDRRTLELIEDYFRDKSCSCGQRARRWYMGRFYCPDCFEDYQGHQRVEVRIIKDIRVRMEGGSRWQ